MFKVSWVVMLNMPPYFYHCTDITGFTGIISNHNGDLELQITRSDQMRNDPDELKWVYENQFIPKSALIATFISCFSENIEFMRDAAEDYGNIILVLSSRKTPLFQRIVEFMPCVYTDSNCPNVSGKTIANIAAKFVIHMNGFRVKRTKWQDEKEWRLVLNPQEGEKVYERSNGKQYIIRQLPHECLIAVLIASKRTHQDVDELKAHIETLLHQNGFNIEVAIV